jgi:predicted dienelactone hydrolase
MRPLEILLFAALAGWLSVRGSRPSRAQAIAWIGGLACLLALHLLVDGSRWSMAPAYLLVALSLVALGWRLMGPPASDRRRLLGRISGAIVVGLALVPAWLFPLVSFDRPTGPFSVGAAAFEWEDPTRPERLTPVDSSDHRRLPVEIWYPAPAGTRGTPQRYHPDPTALAQQAGGGPTFMTSGLFTARTHSIPNAPLADAGGRLPLILFSHGWGGHRFQNTFLVEQLASHGYVVASIEHTYMASGTVLAGGKPAPFIGMDGMTRTTHLDSMATIWSADARFVLDRLDSLDRSDSTGRFRGRLALDRVGYMGMSFGGASAVETGGVDPRVVAVLDIDGPFNGTVRLRGPLGKPIALFRSRLPDTSAMDEKMLAASGIDRRRVAEAQHELETDEDNVLQGGGIKLYLESAGHMNFTDLPLLSPFGLKLAKVVGPGNPRRIHRIVDVYALAFFDQYLRNRPSPLLAGPSPDYPEVRFIRK